MKIVTSTMQPTLLRKNFLKDKIILGIEILANKNVDPKLVKKINIKNAQSLLKTLFKSSI